MDEIRGGEEQYIYHSASAVCIGSAHVTMHIVWVSMDTEIIIFYGPLSWETRSIKASFFMHGGGKNMEEVTFALPASRDFSILVYLPSQFIQLFSKYNWWQVSWTVNQTLLVIGENSVCFDKTFAACCIKLKL